MCATMQKRKEPCIVILFLGGLDLIQQPWGCLKGTISTSLCGSVPTWYNSLGAALKVPSPHHCVEAYRKLRLVSVVRITILSGPKKLEWRVRGFSCQRQIIHLYEGRISLWPAVLLLIHDMFLWKVKFNALDHIQCHVITFNVTSSHSMSRHHIQCHVNRDHIQCHVITFNVTSSR